MADINTLTIESSEQGSMILKKINTQIEITEEELHDALADFQEKKLAKQREQYEKLKPTGFDYAPKSAKEKWEEFENTDNLEKLQWIYDNVSYNADHTMNILKFDKTFCEDISGDQLEMDFNDAEKLATSKGYTLMTDYNDTDSNQEKKQSDWYKLINLFSSNKGDTFEGMELFRDMAGCNNRYWTSTKYKNNKGEELAGFVRVRKLNEYGGIRGWSNIDINYNRVCGFKLMNNVENGGDYERLHPFGENC